MSQRASRQLAVPLATLAALLLATLAALLLTAPCADAGEEAETQPSWRLEQPEPPAPPPGVKGSATPIGLGKIGDIEFWAPNRGLLITAGNPPSIPPGVWAYDGVGWHELATVCGATDGRIAWAGPDEFWTVSDGRPGQANVEGARPPLEDDTLCHFAAGEVQASYASLAFKPDSYQQMHAAGCYAPEDCWFAGDLLPSPQVGAFHLHWNGRSLAAEPTPQGHAVYDLRLYEGQLYESVQLEPHDEGEAEPAILHLVEPSGIQPTFLALAPGVPSYGEGEFPDALAHLQLSASQTALWGAANPRTPTPEGSASGQATIVRNRAGQWTQALPNPEAPEADPFAGEVIDAIAAEDDPEHAWLALDTRADAEAPSPTAAALLARVSADGAVTERQSLPSTAEREAGVGPKGAAAKLTCPAVEDCWMATSKGWLYHLTTPESRAREIGQPDTDPDFSHLITVRPPDEGIPQVAPDTIPVDNSGLLGELPEAALVPQPKKTETRVPVPLLTHLHSRLIHGSILELRFHLAVRARVRLLAKRHRATVAQTPKVTLAAGNRRLLLVLDPRRWPTKLDLQTHALAPLPTTATTGPGTNSVGTDFHVLPALSSLEQAWPAR